ncbi:hypothetical protein H8959_015957 [Pygathrix nigripes]
MTIPGLGHEAGRGAGHPEGPRLAAGALGTPGSSLVFSRPSLVALRILRGGDSQEGDAPWQRPSVSRLAVLQPAFWPAFCQRHVVRMRRKHLLWPRHLLVTTQDDQGALQVDDPYIPPDCYYLGYLEEVPLSMVTVDTCYGVLRGIMKLDDLAYEIKPLQDSRRFKHVVSQIVAEPNAMGPTFRDGDSEETDPLFSEANDSMNPRLSPSLYSSHRSNIKGHVQCSNSYYRIYGNITTCCKEVVQMFSVVDSIVQNTDLRYYIYLLTIYNSRDPAPVNQYQVCSAMFICFRRTFFDTFHVHSSTLLIKDAPHESNYEPQRYSFCSHFGLIHIGTLGRHYLLVAVITTHKLMRSFGVAYDYKDCTCQRRTSCIMQRYPGMTDAFSNCSYGHLQNCFVNSGWCVFEALAPVYNETVTTVLCGNLIVEGREECDVAPSSSVMPVVAAKVTVVSHRGASVI